MVKVINFNAGKEFNKIFDKPIKLHTRSLTFDCIAMLDVLLVVIFLTQYM